MGCAFNMNVIKICLLIFIFLTQSSFGFEPNHDLYVSYDILSKKTNLLKNANYYLGTHFSEADLCVGYHFNDWFSIEGGYSRLLSRSAYREYPMGTVFEDEGYHGIGFHALFGPVVFRSKLESESLFARGFLRTPVSFIDRAYIFYGGGLKFTKSRFERRCLVFGGDEFFGSRVLHKNRIIPIFMVGLEYGISDNMKLRGFLGFERTSSIRFKSDVKCYPLNIWLNDSYFAGIGLLFY